MPVLETKGAASSQGFGQFALQAGGAEQAEAIDFDGTNDYLSRSTDLTGNTDGKTFTFSAWIYPAETGSWSIYSDEFLKFSVFGNNNQVILIARNGAGTNVLYAEAYGDFATLKTFTNILVSCDLTSTSNRYVYINDIDKTSSFTWTTYSNDTIDFTNANHSIGDMTTGGYKLKERLSNVFLDYTYRDLSNVNNRRLFVTADLKPAAGQAALNPILYLKMDDPTTAHINSGTGGNFTLTGTVARSGRGPNQYNAPYSTFDGVNDFLRRTTMPSGASSSKQFTFAFNIQRIGSTERVLVITSNLVGQQIWFNSNFTSSSLSISASNSSNVTVLGMTYSPSGGFVTGRNYNVVISVDLENTSNRYVFVNGNNVTSSVTWSTYTNSAIGFGSTTYWSIASRVNTDWPSGNGTSNANIGALWFNTSYIDLSVADNLAKFVTGTGIDAKPVDLGASGELPTGTSPLIYLPMYGNNAGKNYGTGGDFTVNSGPYLGARGPNEFWGNRASFDGSTTYLARTSGVGASDGKTFSLSLWFNPTANESGDSIFNIGPDEKFFVRRNTSNQFNIFAYSPSGTALNVTTNSTIATDNTWYHVLVCVDLSNTAKRFIYINGTLFASTWSTYSSTINFNFSASNYTIGGLWNGSSYPSASVFDGGIAELYFTTTYIDFSQEANRLKFRDAFGNPVNLTQQIEDAAIPTPAIYMRFPPTSFGTNYGTGGNFTVNGTITDGGQL